ncbi:hypothetical protein UA08_08511 [Talaromyces atroroseus]|uniref:HECT-type E3 ubiquitin transferase n=1 Tax=Talaromyces atroroseus TaxID=1441469 RepID=A0A1Q5Q813_TALAT|nr:hypothetical protein UA08_08511 [Talaromyces atroroseus]OKL56359.1 hypothetical protein UA08_08511 [Talaromyces atroroseus]
MPSSSIPESRRAAFVCNACNVRKKACDKALPSCGFCAKRNLSCRYDLKARSRKAHRAYNPGRHFVAIDVLSSLDQSLQHKIPSTVHHKSLSQQVLDIIGIANLVPEDVGERYFRTFHERCPIIAPKLFNQRMSRYKLRGDSLPADFAILLLTMHLATVLSNPYHPSHLSGLSRKQLYAKTKSLFSQAQTTICTSLSLIQALLLIATCEYICLRPEAAYISTSTCSGLAQVLGIGKWILSTPEGAREDGGTDLVQIEKENVVWAIAMTESMFGRQAQAVALLDRVLCILRAAFKRSQNMVSKLIEADSQAVLDALSSPQNEDERHARSLSQVALNSACKMVIDAIRNSDKSPGDNIPVCCYYNLQTAIQYMSEQKRYTHLPPRSPDVIVKHTITVEDPAQILIHHKDDRRRNFNSLVRRYKHQILHGCENPNCRTPTCLNYQKRVAEGPFRSYTDLSARTLACYLASQDNPEKALCRSPSRPAADFSPTRHPPHIDYRAYGPERRQQQQPASPHHGGRTESPRHSPAPCTSPGERAGQSSRESLPSGLPRTKDPKSFTQNLFDTLSLRMVEWLPLRQSTADIPDCASPTSARPYRSHLLSEGSKEHNKFGSNDENINKTEKAQIHSVSNNAANEAPTPSGLPKRLQNTTSDLKSTVQSVKRVALEETETWRQTPRSCTENKSKSGRLTSSKSTPSKPLPQTNIPTPPPVLKHRAEKGHKKTTEPASKPRQNRRVSWDGSKVLKEASEISEFADDAREPSKQTTYFPALEESNQKPPIMHNVSNPPSSADTVSHLSADIVDGLSQLLAENEEDAQRWKEEVDNMNIQGRHENYKWRYATHRQREVFPFIAQSVYYGLGNSQHLLKSFRRELPLSPNSHHLSEDETTVDLRTLEYTLRKLQEICPWDLVLNSLWNSLEQLFVPPRDLPTVFKYSRRMSQYAIECSSPNAIQSSTSDEPLSDADAAHMLTVVFFTLITFLPKVDSQTWRGIQQIREAGTVLPDSQIQKLPAQNTGLLVNVTDKLEHDLALRLVHRLVRALTARLAFYEISKAKTLSSVETKQRRDQSVLELLFENLRQHTEILKKDIGQETGPVAMDTPVAAAVIIEWLRTLFLKEWDGKPEIARSEATGGAVQILSSMYKNRKRLGLEADAFYTNFLSERLDAMDMPVEWLTRVSNNKTLHLLSFAFLFPPAALVKYFRAINYAAMSKAYEAGMIVQRQASRTAFNRTIQIADEINLLARLHTSMNQYFVISVRRDFVLLDAFNQIWRRERRELLRPLKVKMGMDLGEEGVDIGGVQQEFMTLAFAQALDPEHGMFTVDPVTRMTWFQPCSLESLEHFELVGILMSLAVYNGLTLPVTFPIAFYLKLLNLKIKHTNDIRDGWPDLAKGLESLLTWSEGDVEDVFMRSYEFSFEALGCVQTVDMERVGRDADWPVVERIQSRQRRRSSFSEYSTSAQEIVPNGELKLSEQPEVHGNIRSFQTGVLKGTDYNTSLNASALKDAEGSSLVTNENRERYVKDYLFWLTDKSIRPQYEAFARGFFTCIDRSSLSMFTPETLQTMIEGTQEIDMYELQRHATYDGGWDAGHPLIVQFWKIVKNYSREQKARLLEFVTASDRIPVSGISSINFVIQRNGTGDDRLPTSYTCYGRLLLPEYTGQTALRKNLDMALKNSRGFGNF